jgi:hypothetical protein
MKGCEHIGDRICKPINSKVRARYFFGNMLVLGNITNITESCMCITTKYRIPLNSIIELLIPLDKNTINIIVRINRYDNINSISLNDSMTVEILDPSDEYLQFVGSFSPA